MITTAMKKLPPEVAVYNRTADFDQDSIPDALKKRHNTKPGVWGRINVTEGTLLYRVLQPELDEVRLEAGTTGIIEPQMDHQVEPLGNVVFFVEFLR